MVASAAPEAVSRPMRRMAWRLSASSVPDCRVDAPWPLPFSCWVCSDFGLTANRAAMRYPIPFMSGACRRSPPIAATRPVRESRSIWNVGMRSEETVMPVGKRNRQIGAAARICNLAIRDRPTLTKNQSANRYRANATIDTPVPARESEGRNPVRNATRTPEAEGRP